jgi:hypothetical protein
MTMALEVFTRYYSVDLLAMILTFIGLYLIGSKKKFGFVVASIGNALWVVLGIIVQSSGLIFANIVIVILYIRGFLRWKKQ